MTLDYDKAMRQKRFKQKKTHVKNRRSSGGQVQTEKISRKPHRPKINWGDFDDTNEDEFFELYEE